MTLEDDLNARLEALGNAITNVRKLMKRYSIYVASTEPNSESEIVAIVNGTMDLTPNMARDLEERLSRLQAGEWIGEYFLTLYEPPPAIPTADAVLNAVLEEWNVLGADYRDEINTAWDGS
jgi:hypothetical protein